MLFPCSVDVIALKICSLVVISGVSGGIGLLFVTFDRTNFYPKLSTGIKLDILRDKIFHSTTNRRIMVLTLPRVTTRAITQFKITQTTRRCYSPPPLSLSTSPKLPRLWPPPLLLSLLFAAAAAVAIRRHSRNFRCRRCCHAAGRHLLSIWCRRHR